MIKYLVMDVDGTMTDGKIYIGNDGEIMKAFNVKDGFGIALLLKKADIEPIIITGRTSQIVENRCKELGIKKVFQGTTNKIDILNDLIGRDNLNECAYIGDDIFDLQCMNAIKASGGVVGCPKDAVESVKEISDYKCIKGGGDGCVREFIEFIIAEKKND